MYISEFTDQYQAGVYPCIPLLLRPLLLDFNIQPWLPLPGLINPPPLPFCLHISRFRKKFTLTQLKKNFVKLQTHVFIFYFRHQHWIIATQVNVSHPTNQINLILYLYMQETWHPSTQIGY